MFKLRCYQKEQQDSVISALSSGSDKLLIVASTGAGKTCMFSSLFNELLKRYQLKILVLVPKNILVSQTVEKINGSVTIYNAGLKQKDFSGDVVVGSVQSVAAAKDIPKFNILVIDECHRANMVDGQHAKVYQRLLEQNDKLKAIGYTATPFNADGYIYNEDLFWNKPVFEIGLTKLTNLGYLVPLLYKRTENEIDISSVKKTKEDYVKQDLERVILSDKGKVGAMIEDMIEKSSARNKIIILTTSIKHAELVHSFLPSSNIIHSKRKDRDGQLDEFKKSGRYLVSVLIASEGFDFPPADCLAMMRPTRSPVLYMQAAGRVLRPSEGKDNALFLDYGNIVENLGEIYDLNIEDKNKKEDFKFCIECDVMNKADAKKCKSCSNIFMTQCEICFEIKPYGESCCEKQKRDLLKKLTEKSYEAKPIWRNVTQLLVLNHKSKAGNECYKIDFYSGVFKVHTEYVRKDLSWRVKQMKQRYGDNFERIPKKICLKKEGKYNRLIEEVF